MKYNWQEKQLQKLKLMKLSDQELVKLRQIVTSEYLAWHLQLKAEMSYQFFLDDHKSFNTLTFRRKIFPKDISYELAFRKAKN